MSSLEKSSLDQLKKLIHLDDLHPTTTQYLSSYHGPLAIACSGGPDSIFLLLAIHLLFPQNNLTVLHFNHKTRPGENDLEQSLVQQITAFLNLNLELASPPEPLLNPSEATLRALRLNFFHQTILNLHIPTLLLGHHLDDLAESFLINLSRGRNTQGLSSPKPAHQYNKNILHLRPLMSLTKSHILNFLNQANIPFCTDSSNQKNNYFRNNVRNNLIPLWKSASPTNFYKGLALSREQLEEDAHAINFFLKKLIPSPQKNHPQDLSPLLNHPKALLRRAIRQWLDAQNLTYSYPCLKQILDNFFSSHSPKITSINNTSISYENFTLKILPTTLSAPHIPPTLLPFNTPTPLPSQKSLLAEIIPSSPSLITQIISGKINNAHTAYLSLSNSTPSLTIRSWLPGDSYTPLNAPGSKKIQNLFTDKKIPLAQRHLLPFILYGNEILWIPNFPINNNYKVFPDAKSLLKLTYT